MWKPSELMFPVEVGSYFNADDLTLATICGIIIHITIYMEATHETTFYFLSAYFSMLFFRNR